MTWKSRDLDLLVTADVDDVVKRGRSMTGKERTAALRDSLERLAESTEQLERLKVLLFIQSLLAAAQDGKLAASIADPAANELARVITSASDSAELKRPALDSLALVFLKAKELNTNTDVRVRAAFAVARKSPDPHVSEFARRALSSDGVLTRRVVQRQYRYVTVSIIKTAATLAALGSAGYLGARAAKKKHKAKQAKSASGATRDQKSA
jgi:hypothetical protein